MSSVDRERNKSAALLRAQRRREQTRELAHAEWAFDIEDEKAIPPEYLQPDLDRIHRAVTGSKGRVEIPGVRIYRQKKGRIL